MPPSTRRRAQQHELRSPDPAEGDSDSEIDISFARQNGQLQQGEELGEDLLDVEGEEDLEDEEEEALASPGQAQIPLANLDPPPSYFRDISTLASWRVSSSKPGCSIPQLRHPSTALFWQSDGPQPHYLNIHFFKLVRIVGLRLYLDFEQDESYTPTRIVFLAGSGMNDLQEWGEMKLENPRGWIWADFSGVGEPESDSEDEDEDEEPGRTIDLDRVMQEIEATVSMARQEASSDSENNIPQQQQHHYHHHPSFPPPTNDQMHLDPHTQTTPQPQPHFNNNNNNNMTATPTFLHPHHQATPSFPPSLARPNPRLPFASLSPNPTALHASPRQQRRPKMPVLRAHLVQIKIMENHQNGKDTHLRGLQIFARNDDKEGAREPVRKVVATGMEDRVPKMGNGASWLAMKKAKAGRRAEKLELGGFGEGDDIR